MRGSEACSESGRWAGHSVPSPTNTVHQATCATETTETEESYVEVSARSRIVLLSRPNRENQCGCFAEIRSGSRSDDGGVRVCVSADHGA